MDIERDPVEKTKQYEEAMKIIQPELDVLSKSLKESGRGFGSCHVYWKRKKELLKEFDIDWKTPKEMNPHTRFD